MLGAPSGWLWRLVFEMTTDGKEDTTALLRRRRSEVLMSVGKAFCVDSVGEGGPGDEDRAMGSGDDGGDGELSDIPKCRV